MNPIEQGFIQQKPSHFYIILWEMAMLRNTPFMQTILLNAFLICSLLFFSWTHSWFSRILVSIASISFLLFYLFFVLFCFFYILFYPLWDFSSPYFIYIMFLDSNSFFHLCSFQFDIFTSFHILTIIFIVYDLTFHAFLKFYKSNGVSICPLLGKDQKLKSLSLLIASISLSWLYIYIYIYIYAYACECMWVHQAIYLPSVGQECSNCILCRRPRFP